MPGQELVNNSRCHPADHVGCERQIIGEPTLKGILADYFG
jgi:hypothetical protein